MKYSTTNHILVQVESVGTGTTSPGVTLTGNSRLGCWCSRPSRPHHGEELLFYVPLRDQEDVGGRDGGSVQD